MSSNSLSDIDRCEIAAHRIMARLFRHMDTLDYEPIGALFCEDGVWTRLGKRMVGPDEIVATLRERSSNRLTQHVVSNTVVDMIDANNAQVFGYLSVFVKFVNEKPRDSEGRKVDVVASFEASIRLTERGWRLSSLETLRRFVGEKS